LKTILQHTRIFLVLFVLYLVCAGVLLLVFAKGDLEVLLNRQHHPAMDVLFYWATYLGDGLLAIPILLVVALFVNMRQSILMTGILLLVSGVTLLLKRSVFSDVLRPSAFLKDIKDIYYIEGLDIHSTFSFPSGHSTQAFCLFFLFSFYVKEQKWQFLFFLLAFFAAVSRIYLLQHFLIDTYVGAFIGTAGSVILLYLAESKHVLSRYTSLNKPLISLR